MLSFDQWFNLLLTLIYVLVPMTYRAYIHRLTISWLCSTYEMKTTFVSIFTHYLCCLYVQMMFLFIVCQQMTFQRTHITLHTNEPQQGCCNFSCELYQSQAMSSYCFYILSATVYEHAPRCKDIKGIIYTDMYIKFLRLDLT